MKIDLFIPSRSICQILLLSGLCLNAVAAETKKNHAATILHSENHTIKCPSNYHRDGDYCMPTKVAKKGIKKSGKCPNGYFADGDFCMKSGKN